VATVLWDKFDHNVFIIGEPTGDVHHVESQRSVFNSGVWGRITESGQPQIVCCPLIGRALSFDVDGQLLWRTPEHSIVVSPQLHQLCGRDQPELLTVIGGPEACVAAIGDDGTLSRRFDTTNEFENIIPSSAGTCSNHVLAHNLRGCIADVSSTTPNPQLSPVAAQFRQPSYVTSLEHTEQRVLLCFGKVGSCVIIDAADGRPVWCVKAKSKWPSFHAVPSTDRAAERVVISDQQGVRAYDTDESSPFTVAHQR
jgi:hypothetical protein